MPITFPASYAIDPKNFIQGPTRAWYAPYVAAGADPSTGNIVSLGAIDKGGFEWDHKLTYSETELDQSTVPADAFLSKQEYDIKINFLELSPANLNIMLGFNAASLVSGGGINTQSMGEPFDVQAGANPSMRPTYRQLILQFPSSGHDNTTSPIGAWGYLQLFKTYVQAHGAIKFNKDNMAMVAVTFRALADFTVSGAYKMGKLILQ
jgi:hypothetical protein